MKTKCTSICAALVGVTALVSACSGDSFPTAAQAQARDFDLVFSNARVLDPETNLDAIRNVGVSGDKIAAISDESLTGSIRIDATGLVLAPGFIDLHSHSMGYETATYQAMDGRTTRLELEAGV